MGKLKTKNYLVKRIINDLFGEKEYNRIKARKIIWDFKSGNTYEMSNILPYLISPDNVVLDIGANMGQYACRFHEQIKNGLGQVHSFEPVSDNFSALSFLKEKLGLKKLKINHLGVGKAVEDLDINIPMYENGLVVGTRASLVKHNEIRHRTERIHVTTIDTYMEENGIDHVEFIKCDTEGNEPNVLKGGEKTIAKHLPILCMEVSHNDECAKSLKSLGYEFYYFEPGISKLRKVEESKKGNLVTLTSAHKEKLSEVIDA